MKIKFFFIFFLVAACTQKDKKQPEIETISEPARQDSIFSQLIAVTQNIIPESKLNDSLTFLLLPVEASCPSCRNKTIDSLVKHKNILRPGHYVIISVNGGKKTINSYFRDRNAEIPPLNNTLFLDSTDIAGKYRLYDKNPSLYFTHNRKAYKKVIAIPATVKSDLKNFFSGS